MHRYSTQAIAILLTFWSVGCGSDSFGPAGPLPNPDGVAGRPMTPQTPEEIFRSVCSGCHGLEGEGTERAYEIKHPVPNFPTWVVRNGRPGLEFERSAMPSFDTTVVSDEALEEIFAHLGTFPQPETGEGLFLDYCRNCHGLDASGGVVEQDIREEGFADLAETVREGSALGDVGNRLSFMPAFDEATLSDTELRLIADYIGSL